jgi:hypothetical protein
MSPEAIDRRLREVAQLLGLGMTILKAKRLGKVGDAERDGEQAREAPEAAPR